MRRLCVWIALLGSAAGLSGCAVDGAMTGRPAAAGAAKLLADSRSALGAQGSIRIVRRVRSRDGQRSATTIALQYRGIDIASHQSDGIDEDLRVLDGSAWSRGNPLYWVSSQGLESSQVALASRGWDAMPPGDLHLPAWLVHALGDPTLLERCELVSIPGGRLSIAGHESFEGHASTVLADRAPRGAERERIVIDSAPPYLPEQISLSGGMGSDPACGVSPAAGRAVQSATVTFQDAGSVALARPHATLSEAQYESLVAAPSVSSPRVPASLAHLIAGRYQMTGRIAATLGVRGDRVGERVSVQWTLTPHCTGATCRVLLSVGEGRPVPVRASRFGLFARPRFAGRCTSGGRVIPTEIGLTVHAGRLHAWSSEATTACGGPSADYVVWQAG